MECSIKKSQEIAPNFAFYDTHCRTLTTAVTESAALIGGCDVGKDLKLVLLVDMNLEYQKKVQVNFFYLFLKAVCWLFILVGVLISIHL